MKAKQPWITHIFTLQLPTQPNRSAYFWKHICKNIDYKYHSPKATSNVFLFFDFFFLSVVKELSISAIELKITFCDFCYHCYIDLTKNIQQIVSVKSPIFGKCFVRKKSNKWKKLDGCKLSKEIQPLENSTYSLHASILFQRVYASWWNFQSSTYRFKTLMQPKYCQTIDIITIFVLFWTVILILAPQYCVQVKRSAS